LCCSHGIAEYLGRRVDTFARDQRPVYVGTFQSFGIAWGTPPGSDDDPAYWERQLPEVMASMAAHPPFFERFDAIVIDEAHDFPETWWPAVLAALRTPLDSELYVFSDENQRVLARRSRPPVPLTVLDLTENLRNTKQIAGTFSSLTPAVMRARGGHGTPVRFCQCAADEAIDQADGVIETLQQVGWPARTLALLTTDHLHPCQVEQQSAGQDGYWRSFWEDEHPFYGHVQGFSGLERPAIVLAINGFRDERRAREMLYVGLSRARDLLVVCGDIAMIQRLGGDGVANRLTRPAAAPAAVRT